MNAPTLSSQSPEQTYSDQWPTSNAELLNAIFTALPEPLRVKVLGFPGNPKAHKGWGGHPWHPGSDVATERPDWNWYYTLAVYQPTPEGKYSRTAAQCRAIYGVMLDDLGTKAAPLSRLATCPPSLVIETSDNNYQAAYLFDVPQTDVKLIDDLNQAMVNAGLCDSEAKSPATRWGRLPFARNGKTDPSPPLQAGCMEP